MKYIQPISALLLGVSCLCILSACAPVENDIAGEDTPQVITPTPTEKSAEEREQKPVEPTLTPKPLETAPHAPLSATGPWYVVANEEGLYAFNMDGSGLTKLTSKPNSEYYSISSGVAATKGRIAYLTEESMYEELTLHIINMANWQEQKIIPLTSEDTALGSDPDDYWANLDFIRAIVEVGSFRWSPNGEMLAFFAGIEGPTSDLYVYTPTTDKIIRLTDGPSQGFRPIWSPDNKFIVHVGASNFGTGAGYNIQGVWAAKSDASEVITIDPPGPTGNEGFLGWKDNSTFVSYSWSAADGPNNIRFTNMFTSEVDVVWEYLFSDVAFGDPNNPRFLVSVDKYASDYHPDGLMGIYVLDPPDYNPEPLFKDSSGYVWWVGNDTFYALTDEGAFLVTRFDIIDISYITGSPFFSDSGVLAWFGDDGL
ncbi:MAG: hypothetical protein PVF83_08830 [Anaerolineales bacterium]|jgi:hypothetical protein